MVSIWFSSSCSFFLPFIVFVPHLFLSAQCLYLSPVGTDAIGGGSSSAPLQSIRYALETMVSTSSYTNTTLYLRPGLYVSLNPEGASSGITVPGIVNYDPSRGDRPSLVIIPDPDVVTRADNAMHILDNQQITISTEFSGAFLSITSVSLHVVVEDIIFTNNSDGITKGILPLFVIAAHSLTLRRCYFHRLRTPSTDNKLEAGLYSGAVVSGPSASTDTSVTVENCIIEDCVSKEDAGAIHLETGMELRLSNTIFRGPSTSRNGNQEETQWVSSLCLLTSFSALRLFFSFSIANSAQHGGAIYLLSKMSLIANNVTFSYNSATIQGGALMLAREIQASFTNCVFESNSVFMSYGGAVYVSGAGSRFAANQSQFISNLASYGAGIQTIPITECPSYSFTHCHSHMP